MSSFAWGPVCFLTRGSLTGFVDESCYDFRSISGSSCQADSGGDTPPPPLPPLASLNEVVGYAAGEIIADTGAAVAFDDLASCPGPWAHEA